MNDTTAFPRAGLALLLGSLTLAGCAEAPKTLYQWEGYQPQLNEYFKGESPEAQLEALEAGLEKIKAKNGAVPPGYHAQLGLLYSGIGKDDQMIREFETEKALFPESATYMDFLMDNAKGEHK
ncbi:DUF4810 domain-containing protein [Pseudomonas sp. ABC1]|uniref:DUF4810 domain-containing protein n=1 Tax=Pseudomonas sp. ABC1 TaxID=2748080 RepID=UPI0015C2EB90|nr:DUF4810 domain-containing protein [Pseudomonas sp. ABC1]QLF94437.1 DUF4810 domain-containing protein [Pseudomonas sp. ABC1]